MAALKPIEIGIRGARAIKNPRAAKERYHSTVSYSAQSTDVLLMLAVCKGDEQAMIPLIERHLPAITALARRMLGAEDAEDIAQEVMFRLWRDGKILQIDERGVRPWLYRVASNLCLDQLRKRRELTGVDIPEGAIAADQDRQIGQRQLSAAVELVVARLPERQKLALALFHFEGLSQRDTAEIMDITEDAIESLLRRARAGLKNALAENWKDLMPEPGE